LILNQAIDEVCIKKSVEFSTLTFVTTSLSNQYSQYVNLQLTNPIHSIVSTYSLVISQTVIPIICVVITTIPTT